MRVVLLIFIFCLSCLSFGQDSLKIDTTFKTFTPAAQDSVLPDPGSAALKTDGVKKKIKKKKIQKFNNKEKTVDSKELNAEKDNVRRNNYGLTIIGVLVIMVLVVFAFARSTFVAKAKLSNTSSNDDNYISDYLYRKFLTRRDYYRNVYLKSEEWKRKRYVVLKRDNWRCVYCGGRATQVHHTRYAKRNIGKEPIEWLVSICKTCHDSKH